LYVLVRNYDQDFMVRNKDLERNMLFDDVYFFDNADYRGKDTGNGSLSIDEKQENLFEEK